MLSLTYLDNIAQENIFCNVFSDVSTPRTTLHRLIKGVCVCAMLSLRDSRHHSTENNPLCNVVLILLEHCTGETLCNILKAPDKIAQEKTCSLLLSKYSLHRSKPCYRQQHRKNSYAMQYSLNTLNASQCDTGKTLCNIA